MMMPPEKQNEWNGQGDKYVRQSSVLPPRISNFLKGRITSLHQGLTRMGCHVKLTEGATLRVRWPSVAGERHSVQIGQQVSVNVPSGAVLLAAGRLGLRKRRWNIWEGRIVLVESNMSCVVTVKVLGAQLTLKSTVPVLGVERSPRAWDVVDILIDPEKITINRQNRGSSLRPRLMTERITDSRVWLMGHIEAVRQANTGWLLSLEIGKAHVSALVSGEEDIPWGWMPSMEVEVNIGQWEAWVKPRGQHVEPVLCRLLYDNL